MVAEMQGRQASSSTRRHRRKPSKPPCRWWTSPSSPRSRRTMKSPNARFLPVRPSSTRAAGARNRASRGKASARIIRKSRPGFGRRSKTILATIDAGADAHHVDAAKRATTPVADDGQIPWRSLSGSYNPGTNQYQSLRWRRVFHRRLFHCKASSIVRNRSDGCASNGSTSRPSCSARSAIVASITGILRVVRSCRLDEPSTQCGAGIGEEHRWPHVLVTR